MLCIIKMKKINCSVKCLTEKKLSIIADVVEHQILSGVSEFTFCHLLLLHN